MGEYTYKDAIKGTLPTGADTFYIHGLKYDLAGSNLFFSNPAGVNSKIFTLVGYENANDLFTEILGEGNFRKAYGGSSPYAMTYENARKILIKLWQTPRFPVHTLVKVKPDLKEGENYGVYCNSDMVEYAGKTVEITSKSIYDNGKYGYNVLYQVKYNGEATGWNWTEDMFCEAPVESATKSEDEEYSIPKIALIKELKLKQDCVNTQISIQLPKHSKHLKITL